MKKQDRLKEYLSQRPRVSYRYIIWSLGPSGRVEWIAVEFIMKKWKKGVRKALSKAGVCAH